LSARRVLGRLRAPGLDQSSPSIALLNLVSLCEKSGPARTAASRW